ncbi:TPA: hypothetical protein ACGXND_003659 [Bacillus tropicus]
MKVRKSIVIEAGERSKVPLHLKAISKYSEEPITNQLCIKN